MIVDNNARNYNKIHNYGGTINGLYGKILNQNHTLIAGATGSGKSVMINGIIRSAIVKHPKDVQLVLLDPKKVELVKYKNLPHTILFCDEVNQMTSVLEYCCKIMDSRYKEMQKAGSVLYSGSDIYIVFDEFADALLSTDGKKIEKLVQRIAQLGRAAKIHLIMATQCPNRRVLKAEIVVNMTCLVALRCKTEIESRQIIGESGAEDLPKYGKCLVSFPGEDVIKTSVYMYSNEELNNVVDFYIKQKKHIGLFRIARKSRKKINVKELIKIIKSILSIAFLVWFAMQIV